MTIEGFPASWIDLLDPLVPQIIELVVATWEGLQRPAPDEREDDVSNRLCAALRKGRDRSEYQFQIHPQAVILEPDAGEELGRMDIAFWPLIPSEEIYFCLECKRLNVVYDGKARPYTAEYVAHGMLRFVTGQYSRSTRHGGMLGYVYDGNVAGAMANVEANINARVAQLGMAPPGRFLESTIRRDDPHARETHHRRQYEQTLFRLHHLFVRCRSAEAPAPPSVPCGD